MPFWGKYWTLREKPMSKDLRADHQSSLTRWGLSGNYLFWGACALLAILTPALGTWLSPGAWTWPLESLVIALLIVGLYWSSRAPRRDAAPLATVTAADVAIPYLTKPTVTTASALESADAAGLDPVVVGAARQSIGEIRGLSDGLSGVSGQLGRSSFDAKAGADATASALEHILTRIESVAEDTHSATEGLQRTASSVSQANNLVSDAALRSNEGRQLVADLRAASDQVGAVTGAIAAIAKQTRLLA